MNLRRAVLLLFWAITLGAEAQIIDSLKPGRDQYKQVPVFQGTRIATSQEDVDSNGRLTISGYASVYYAVYSDSAGPGNYHAFPTVSPQGDAFGLNIVQLSARYSTERLRGVITLHGGDIPRSAWSARYNFLQEANVGFRLVKNLWLDAGFFRTHIGLESIQPRENITMSLATTTYFEPYFLSGAKLTWYINPRLYLQLNAFNSFNTFVDNNKKKAIGLSAYYEASKKLNFTFNTIVTDDAPKGSLLSKTRNYTNIYMIYRGRKWDIGAEVNGGWQEHSKLSDSTASSTLFSSLLAFKYHLKGNWSVYVRGEYFNDPDEILTGPVEDENHRLVGLSIWGTTAGIEYKPIPNAYVRIESRYLEALPKDQVFAGPKGNHHERWEGILALGFWF